ncbi:hypothetical protein ACFQS1_40460 [Paractinoplanes rhizophilus]|uniref:Helix-turn-helix domain-containing protein n=1 Tax=Paractinoplanes rhizophilus TaxID=1416877 RepID=A0ABW2I5S6_9ACTN
MVIGAALAARAAGRGYRQVAAALRRAPDTVRGWLRRFAVRVEAVRAVFTEWCGRLDPDPVLPDPAGTAWADALAAIDAAARAVHDRFGAVGADRVGGGSAVVVVPVWEVAVAVSAGRLLAPGWPSSRV